ncbi:MAG TPA: cupin domain-containing protein [Vicinamibacterales bacterium]|nr:cupin domain-containing protein [Vicinamibacterales bacterium]
MKAIASVITAAAILGGASYTALHAQSHTHVMQTVKEAQWGPAPPFIPAGAEIAVLSGDPTKAVAFSVRLKFPANYSIAAHSHPTDENVVVVSGALTMGNGEKLTKGAGNKVLGVGGYALVPAGMNHFAYTTAQETTIVLYGTGPVDFKYVNPADDPRTGKKSE